MDELIFKKNHHSRVNKIAHTTGLGILVPDDDKVMDDYIMSSAKFTKLHNAWHQSINQSLVNNSIKALRRKLVNKKILDIFLTAFITNRIYEKEQIALGIEKWKLSLSPPSNLNLMETIKWKYVNLKGWRRFDHNIIDYNYWVRTGLCPYSF